MRACGQKGEGDGGHQRGYMMALPMPGPEKQLGLVLLTGISTPLRCGR